MSSFFKGIIADSLLSFVNPNLAETRRSAEQITKLLCVIVRRYHQENEAFTETVSMFMDSKMIQCEPHEKAKHQCLELLKTKFFQEGDFDIDSLLMDLKKLERIPGFNFTTLLTVIEETISSVLSTLTATKDGQYQVDTNIIMGLFALEEYAEKIKFVDGKIQLDGLNSEVKVTCHTGEIPEFTFSSLNDLDRKLRIELDKSLQATNADEEQEKRIGLS